MNKHYNRSRAIFSAHPLAWAVVCVLILAGLVLGMMNHLWQMTLGRIEVIEADHGDEAVVESSVDSKTLNGIRETKALPNMKGVNNILLLGSDSRDPNSTGERSDSMMVLTINREQKKLKLLSLQRDMLVEVPGREMMDKLTHAHAYGGAKLSMATVNNCLRLGISQYAEVNMYNMERVIDVIGGLEIEVLPAEVPVINRCIEEANRVFPNTVPSPYLQQPGLQILNGRQVVGFARDRDSSRDGFVADYARMYRQRMVLQKMFERFLEVPLDQKLDMIGEAMGMIRTNIKHKEILTLVQDILPLMKSKIEQMQVPIEGYYTSYSGHAWSNLCDFNGMIPLVQQFIFGRTFDFDPVFEVPGAPGSSVTLPAYVPLASEAGLSDDELVDGSEGLSATLPEGQTGDESVDPWAWLTSTAESLPSSSGHAEDQPNGSSPTWPWETKEENSTWHSTP